MEDDSVQIQNCNWVHEANLVVSVLAGDGIEAFLPMPTLLAVVRNSELLLVEFACLSTPPTLTAREKFWPPQSPTCPHLGMVSTSSDCRRSPSKRSPSSRRRYG